MWPDWAIICTLGYFLKLLATINLPRSPTFLSNFCKGVKIYHFSGEIIFGQLLQAFGNFYLVTLVTNPTTYNSMCELKYFLLQYGEGLLEETEGSMSMGNPITATMVVVRLLYIKRNENDPAYSSHGNYIVSNSGHK